MRATSQASLDAAAQAWEPVLAAAGEKASEHGQQLFGVVDVLDGSGALRRGLTDPSRDGEARAGLITAVFAPQVAPEVADLLAGLARGRWSEENDLADAVEELAVTSLLAAASSHGGLEALEEGIFRATRLLAENRDLRLALASPDLPRENREGLITSLLGERVGPETMLLLQRVVGSLRGRSIASSLVRISELAAQRRQRLLAVVTSAVPLTQAQTTRLTEMLSRAYGRTMQVNVAVDPQVVGGLRIQVGDEQVDATVLSRLDEARRRLAG